MATQKFNNTVILAKAYEPCMAEIPGYLDYCEKISRSLLDCQTEVRSQMLSDGHIRMSENADPINLSCVDSANISAELGEVRTEIALGIRYQKNADYTISYKHQYGPHCEAFRIMGNALRLETETHLLSESTSITIADNSFWSMLMEGNNLAIQVRQMTNINGRDYLEKHVVSSTDSENGTLFKTINNPEIIAMSKKAISQYTSINSIYSDIIPHPLSDRQLYSSILQPGEFTKVRPLKHVLSSGFGLDKNLFPRNLRDQIENLFTNDLCVTFYKPWHFQKAYRIEFHTSRFNSKHEFMGLLAGIKYGTSIPTIREPEVQFVADKLCKQVRPISKVFGDVNRFRFPEISIPNRT